MRLDRFEIKHDILRSFDPRARLIAGAALILLAVSLSSRAALAGIIVVCLLLLCRDIVCVIKRLLPLEVFGALLFLQALGGFLNGGTAFMLILRINGAALLSMLIIIPLGLGTLAQTLRAFRVNYKLTGMLYLSCRYIYLLHDSVICAVMAMRLRQSPHHRGLIAVWQAYAAVFAAALMRTFVKADGISAALLNRGFDGSIPQTAVWHWKGKDSVLAVCSCIFLAAYGTYTFIESLFLL